MNSPSIVRQMRASRSRARAAFWRGFAMGLILGLVVAAFVAYPVEMEQPQSRHETK